MSKNKKKTYNHAKMMANKKKNKQKQENNKKSRPSKKVSFNYNRQFNELIDLNDDNLAFNNNQEDIYNYYNNKKNDNRNKRRGLFIHSKDIAFDEENNGSHDDDKNKPLRQRRVAFIKSQYNLNEEPKELFKEERSKPQQDNQVNETSMEEGSKLIISKDVFEDDNDLGIINDTLKVSDESTCSAYSSEVEYEASGSEYFSQVEDGATNSEFTSEVDSLYEAEDTENEDEEDLYNYDLEYSIDQSSNGDANSQEDSEFVPDETPITSIINPTKSLTITEPEILFGEDPVDDILTSIDYDIINMQQGANDNRYNIKCLPLFMDSEYHWVATLELSELLCVNLGFPEERLSAFFEHIYNKLIREKDIKDLKLFNQFCDNVELSDGEMSESLDYLIENVLDPEEDQEDDGLQHMLAFSQSMDRQRNLNIDPQDLPKFKMNIKGKGKKRKLILDENQFDDYTRNLLQEKYKLRITKKAEKRTEKRFFISKENETSDNILVKYPYGMHVFSIREEIENFANDNKWLVGSKRSFPPFDPHGNKVIIKFGKHFNLNHKKLVSKQNHYVQLVKTKNTIKKSQNLVHVDLLCRQRPVFMRKDVKMPRDIALKFNGESDTSIKRLVNGTVTDGTVVAAGAREIASDNLGFKILAKMGWSSGMSLGSTENNTEGIKEPVTAVIKKGRKGLGHNSSAK